jgi:hypothetical protein
MYRQPIGQSRHATTQNITSSTHPFLSPGSTTTASIVTYEARAFSRSNLPAPERFSPLDALAALTAHIPEKGQQVVRYCG